MINSVYILKSDGIPLFSGCYNEDIDPNLDLVAGLLSAIFLFAREVGEGAINSVVLENKKYVYSQSEDLIFVICTSDKDDDANAKRVVEKIQTEFIKQYHDILEQELIVEKSIFSNFSITLDNLLGQSITVSSVTDKSAFTNLEMLDSLFETYVKQKLDSDPLYEEKFKKYLKKKDDI